MRMTRSLWSRALFLTVAWCVVTGPVRAAETWLVTPQWLSDRLGREPIVILHLGDRAEYDAAHIPGAQFMALQEISDPKATLRLQMASIDQLKEFFESHGVSDATRIVLYFGRDQMTPLARVFVALDYLGLADRTSILDGGLPAWRAAGKPVTSDVPVITRGTLTPHPRPDVIATMDWVKSHLEEPSVAIIDARTHDYYTGENTRGFPRPGHIAGAVNIPFASLSQETTNVLKDAASLRAIFEAQGIKPETEVVTYCHIGQQASHVYFAARLLGYRVRLYDGSFDEWSAIPDLPIAKGEKKK
jgi:thiosulfate/3-mercaptopyruvate sulfurtransferase